MNFSKTLKLQVCVGDLDLPEKKERGIPAVGSRRKKMHRCALVAKQKRVEPTVWENVNCTRRNGMCCRRR